MEGIPNLSLRDRLGHDTRFLLGYKKRFSNKNYGTGKFSNLSRSFCKKPCVPSRILFETKKVNKKKSFLKQKMQTWQKMLDLTKNVKHFLFQKSFFCFKKIFWSKSHDNKSGFFWRDNRFKVFLTKMVFLFKVFLTKMVFLFKVFRRKTGVPSFSTFLKGYKKSTGLWDRLGWIHQKSFLLFVHSLCISISALW